VGVRVANTAAMSQRFQASLAPAAATAPPATAGSFTLDAGEENRGTVAPGASFTLRVVFTAPPPPHTDADADADYATGVPFRRALGSLRLVSECGAVEVPVVADPAAGRLGAPHLVDFGSAPLLAPTTRLVTVSNPGAVPLALTAEVLQAGVNEFFVSTAPASVDDAAVPGRDARVHLPPGGSVPLAVTFIPYRMHSQAVELVLRTTMAGSATTPAHASGLTAPQPPPPQRVTLLGTACAPGGGDKAALKAAVDAAAASTTRPRKPVSWRERDPGLVLVDARLAEYKAARERRLLATLAARAAGVADGGDADDPAAVARGALTGDAPAPYAYHGVVADGGDARGTAANRGRGARPTPFDPAAMLTLGGMRMPADMSSHAAVAFVLTQASPASPGAAVHRGRLKPRDLAAAVARKRSQHAALLAAAAAAEARPGSDGDDDDAAAAAEVAVGEREGKGDDAVGDVGVGRRTRGRARHAPALEDPFSLTTAEVATLARAAASASPTLSRARSPGATAAPGGSGSSAAVGKSAFAATITQPVLLTALLQASWLFPFLVAKPAGVTDPRGAQVALPPVSSARALGDFLAALTAALGATPDSSPLATGTLVDDLVNAALAAHTRDASGAAADDGEAGVALATLRGWLLRSTAATGIKNDRDAASGIDALALRQMTYRHLCDSVAAEEAHRDYSTAPVRGEDCPAAATLARLAAARTALSGLEAAVRARLLRLRCATAGLRPDGSLAGAGDSESPSVAAAGDAFNAFLLTHPALRLALVPTAVPALPLRSAAGGTTTGPAAWALPLSAVTYDAASADDWLAAADATAAFKAAVARAVVQARVARRLATLGSRMAEAAAVLRTAAAAAGPDEPGGGSGSGAASVSGSRRPGSRAPGSVATRSIAGGGGAASIAESTATAGPGGNLAAHLTKAARASARHARESWLLEDAPPGSGGGGATEGWAAAGAARLAEALAGSMPHGKRSRFAMWPNPTPSELAVAAVKVPAPLPVVRPTMPTTDDAALLLPSSGGDAGGGSAGGRHVWAPAAASFNVPAVFQTTAPMPVGASDDPLGAAYWEAQVAPSLLELAPVPLPVVPAECAPAAAEQVLRDCRLYEAAATGGVGGGAPAGSAQVRVPEVDANVAAAVADMLSPARLSLPVTGRLPATWPLCVPATTGIGANLLWSVALQGGGVGPRAKPAGVLQYNVRAADCALTVPPTYASGGAASAPATLPTAVAPSVTLYASGPQGVGGMPLEGDATALLDAARGLGEPFTTLPPPAPSTLVPLDRSRAGILASLPPALAHTVATGELANRLAGATAAASRGGSRGGSVPAGSSRRGGGSTVLPTRSLSASGMRPLSGTSRISGAGGGGGGGGGGSVVGGGGGGAGLTADEVRDALPRVFMNDATPDAPVDINGVYVPSGTRLTSQPGLSTLRMAEAPAWPRAAGAGGGAPAPAAPGDAVWRPPLLRPGGDGGMLLLAPRAATDGGAVAAASSAASLPDVDDAAQLPRLATDVTPYERRAFTFSPHVFHPAVGAHVDAVRRWYPWGASGAGDAARVPPLLTGPLADHQQSDDSESEPDEEGGGSGGGGGGGRRGHRVPTMAEAVAAFMPGALGRAVLASLPLADGIAAAGTLAADGTPALLPAMDAGEASAAWHASTAAVAATGTQVVRQALTTPLPAALAKPPAAPALAAPLHDALAAATAASAAAYTTDARGRPADNGSVASALPALPWRPTFGAV